jgi:hypothetical protein
MNDTDLDLERRLRAHFRDVRATDAAPLALRADVLAIPRTAGATRTRLGRRRGLTLLAAMVALGIGAAGWAILAGGRTPENPRPSPPAFAIAPSPSSTPARSSDPALGPEPSGSPDGTGPATVDVTTPGMAVGWKAAGTMSEPRILPTATLLQDGRVLVVGGISSDGTAVATAELWDPLARTFSPAGSLARPRIGHAAALLQDGRVLIVGGEDGVDAVPEMAAEVWDPATSRFEAVGSMLRLPSGLTATTLTDGRVLIVGPDACTVAIVNTELGLPRCPGPSVETGVWNPGDGTYAAGPPPKEPRSWHTATRLPDGRVFLVGNGSWSANDPESSEVFDPATNRFIRVAEARDLVQGAQTATLLGDGRVLITGGDTSDPNGDMNYFGPLRTAETWDPVSGTFRRAGRMEVARRAHQAALLPDGRVIVVGGSGERTQNFFDPSTATSEVWDSATGSFSPGPQMADKRARFGLVRLLDGSLLAIGGDARLDARHDEGTALASAEILDFAPPN